MIIIVTLIRLCHFSVSSCSCAMRCCNIVLLIEILTPRAAVFLLLSCRNVTSAELVCIPSLVSVWVHHSAWFVAVDFDHRIDHCPVANHKPPNSFVSIKNTAGTSSHTWRKNQKAVKFIIDLDTYVLHYVAFFLDAEPVYVPARVTVFSNHGVVNNYKPDVLPPSTKIELGFCSQPVCWFHLTNMGFVGRAGHKNKFVKLEKSWL